MLDGDFSQHEDLQCTKITLKELQENIHNVSISHDGLYAAFALGNGCVKIYDTMDMKLKQRCPMGVPFDGLPSTDVKWSPAGLINDQHYVLANVNTAGGLFSWIWDGSDFLERDMRHTEEKNESQALEFSPDGAQVYSAGSDRSIRVYDLETKNLTSILSKGVDEAGHMRTAHANRIFSLRFLSPTTMVSAGWQSPIQVWDIRTGRAERQISGAHPSSNCLEAIPGTTRFFCCSGRPKDQIQVFDFVAGAEIPQESAKFSMAAGASPVASLTFRPEVNMLWAAASKPDAILQIDATTGELVGTVPTPTQLMSIDSSEHMPFRVIAAGMKESVYVVDAPET